MLNRAIQAVVLAFTLAIMMPSTSSASDVEDCENAEALVKTKPEKAVAACRRLAEKGDAEAQNNLGYMYHSGEGVPQNDKEAIKWYRKAAEQGLARAQYNLGVMYEYGQGTAINIEQALNWYRMAAAQGHAMAQDNLGLMYDQGKGVKQNDKEAVKWYRKAADQGLAEAQSNLGSMYASGAGVPKGDKEAVKWFRRAADQGLAGAQYNLGLSYQYGRGVPLDYVEAYRWFDLAAAASPPGAARDNAVKHRDAVAAKMTPDQIAQAKKPIREVSPYCMKAKADFDLMLPLMIAAMRPTVQDRTVIAWGTLISSLEEHTDVDWRERCFSEILQAESISVGPGYEVVRRQANLNGDDEQRDEQPLTPKSAPTGTTIVGSGFIVNADGYVLTNHRVVADCKNVVVIVPGKAGQYAKVISFSADSDLALLQVNQRTSDFATFRGGGQIKQGEEVVLIGYPLRGSPSSRTIVTSGVISAVESIRGDGRYLQITAPVQPGNSGGPILDLSGNVVAVVIGPTKPSSASTDSKIPKNVNLAIKQSIALKLLQDANVGYTTAPSRKRMSVAAVAEQAGLFTVGVGCAE